MNLQWKPYIYEPVIVRRHRDAYLLINPDFCDWVRLDNDGFFIFSRLREGRGLEDLARDLNEASSLTRKEAFLKVKEVLARLSFHQIAFSTEKPLRIYQERVPGLETIYLAVTGACNLACPYCYAEAGQGSSRELTTRELERIIKDGQSLGALRVVFTGGEPLLRSDLFQLAAYARKLGFQTELLTNGTLVNKENIKDIYHLFHDVGVSLDGSTRKIHEDLRGEGTFDQTILGIKLLVEGGVRLTLNTVVTRLNYQDLANLARLAHFFGVSLFQTHHHIPLGRGVNDGLSLSFEEEVRMRQILMKTFEEYSKEDFVQGRIKGEHPLQGSRREKCGTGRSEIFIDSRGDLYPCRMLQVQEFQAGNVREVPLLYLYHSSQILKACRELDYRELRECQDCEVQGLCTGGCRALHYAYTKDLLKNSNVMCHLLKEDMYMNIWLKTGYFPWRAKGG